MSNYSVGQVGLDLTLNNSKFNNQLRNINAQANDVSKRISSSFKKIATAAVAAFSVKKIITFGKECVAAADVQTVAETKLLTVMRQRMNATAKEIQAVKDFASAQQELGVVGDEVQLSGAQQLSTFLKTDDALKTLIPAMNNLAAQQNGVNVSAESMTNIGNLMGKVMQGQTAALTRVGITFSEAQERVLKYGDEQERAAMLAQVITENVGDMNKALASTPAGKIQQIKNSFGDIQETLGRALHNVFAPMLDFIKSIVSKLAELANGFEELTKKLFGDSNVGEINTGGIADVSDEAMSAGESIDNMVESAEKAKRSIAGFDELNIISPESNETNSESSGDTTNKTPINATSGEQSGNSFVSAMEKSFKDIYTKLGLDKFISSIQSGIDSVSWESIGNNCKKIFNSLQPIASAAFSGMGKIGKSSINTLGKLVGGIVSTIGKSLQTITGGVSLWLEKDKTKISQGINTISTNISSGIDSLGDYYDKTFAILGGSVDRMRPTMEKAISDFLGGLSDLGLSIGLIFSNGFSIASKSLSDWVSKNELEISKFFDNLQFMASDLLATLGQIMSDIGSTLTDWWTKKGGGAEIFKNVCDAFTDIGTTFMNIFNDWIKPAWDFIVGVVQSAWDNCLKPIFEQLVSVFGKLAECISTIWNNFLSPIVNWMVDVFGPILTNVFNAVGAVFDTVFTTVGDVVSGIWKTLGGLIDFITGVFSGNWEKAWQGICDFFVGIWNAIWGLIKGVINLIIDAVNLLWTGIYTVIAAIVNAIGGLVKGIGSLFGQEWGWEMPTEPPLIPKLAQGGLVKAPTLALVGDNKGAGSGNPEVVAPLNKLQGMLNAGGENEQVVAMLSKIYELLLAFIGNGGNVYEFVAELEGKTMFKEVVRQNDMYMKTHRGHSAFEGAR